MTDTRAYHRPLVQIGPVRPMDALTLAEGWGWFTHVEVLRRGAEAEIAPVGHVAPELLAPLIARRAPIAGLTLERPRLMAILNATPDSFSDGGQFDTIPRALVHGRAMIAAGADLVDIGGESTRPGADLVPMEEECARTVPLIVALRGAWDGVISIDTRKAPVARAALDAGADVVNDVSALTFDGAMADIVAASGAPICLMHAQGDPKTMQRDPHYDDVVLDVYDWLEQAIERAVAAGIARGRIVVDPGIGFGKTLAHNLALLARISLFHGLGCAVLLGASRKRFIGEIGNAPEAQDRMPGSIAVALAALGQGVQILRVHDMAETKQALSLWQATHTGVSQ